MERDKEIEYIVETEHPTLCPEAKSLLIKMASLYNGNAEECVSKAMAVLVKNILM